ncbi:hypothetical protein ACW0S0_09355 [Fusobacterium polymorphum]
MNIKTKFDGYIVKVGDREIKVGDRVLMDNNKQTLGHGKIYEVVGIKEAIENEHAAYYKLKREDETTLEVEACWFDSTCNKTYLIEE